MAAQIAIVTITKEALAAATIETLIQLIAAANHRVKILEWGIFFNGTSNTAEPVDVQLQRQTDAGTGSSLTPVKLDDSIGETLLTTGQQDFNAEPTSTDEVDVALVHPQSWYVKQFPYGREPKIGGGDRLGLRATAPAIVSCRAYIVFEE